MPYPTNRKQAIKALNDFIKSKLELYGPYQDAIRNDVVVGYHSCLSASLNIGLITPMDIVKAVKKSKSQIQSREGLIRQIIGWREYIRMKYILNGLQPWNYLNSMNVKMPKSWYAGNTKIETLDWSINRVIKYGYAAHIERLMLLLNYSVLLKLKYNDVREWFIRMFVDGYEWAMVNIEMSVNSVGSSQNRFMTRIYLTNSNYLIKQGLKMSKQDQEQMQMLYIRFIKDNLELCKRDYRLAAWIKRMKY